MVSYPEYSAVISKNITGQLTDPSSLCPVFAMSTSSNFDAFSKKNEILQLSGFSTDFYSLPHASCLPDLLFHPEDCRSTFLRNVGVLLHD